MKLIIHKKQCIASAYQTKWDLTAKKNDCYFMMKLSIIKISQNVIAACCPSCCQRMVIIAFPEREKQCFAKITRSSNYDVIIIFQISLH